MHCDKVGEPVQPDYAAAIKQVAPANITLCTCIEVLLMMYDRNAIQCF